MEVAPARTPTITSTAVGHSRRTSSGTTTRSCAGTFLPRSGSAITMPTRTSARTGATSHRIDGHRDVDGGACHRPTLVAVGITGIRREEDHAPPN